MKNLIELNLHRCSYIGNEGIKVLLNSKGIVNLKSLNLSSTMLSDETLLYISSSYYLKNLENLNLEYCLKLSDRGLKAFFKSENIKNIKILNLSFLKKMTDISLIAL